jgi:hypothetical protein
MRRLLLRTAAVMISLGLFYGLSIGPVYKLYSNGYAPQSVFLSLYEPILLLRDRSPPVLADMFDWYMRLWYDNRPHLPRKAENDMP